MMIKIYDYDKNNEDEDINHNNDDNDKTGNKDDKMIKRVIKMIMNIQIITIVTSTRKIIL